MGEDRIDSIASEVGVLCCINSCICSIFVLLRSINRNETTTNPATPRMGFIHAREKSPAKSMSRIRRKSVSKSISLGTYGMIKNDTRSARRMDV